MSIASPQPKSASATAPQSALIRILESGIVQHTILALILLNAVILGLETWPSAMRTMGTLLHTLDQILLGIFTVEIGLRIIAYRKSFFRDPWNIFDATVVSIALMPATGAFAVLRALRVLRVLRVLTIVPSMRRVVGALMSAVPGLISIALVLLLIYYVFAVMATKLFGSAFPDWFGNVGRSLYSLFQIMTLESWSMGISRPVMETYPYAWAFFIPFILVATFTMLNLFIAVIVNAMQTFTESEHQGTRAAVEEARDHIEVDLHSEIKALRSEIRALREGFSALPPPK
jgi:voltage-gated sodium channel